MFSMKKISAALAIVALAAIGMAGMAGAETLKLDGNTYPPMISGDPWNAIRSLDGGDDLAGWGKDNELRIGEKEVMESATDYQSDLYRNTTRYTQGVMESATDLDHTWDQVATMPFDGRGKKGQYFPTATSESWGGIQHKIS